MKKLLPPILGTFVVLFVCSAPLRAEELTRFSALPGGKVRIEGTSTIHDWQMEGHLIGGRLEVGAGFPTEPGQAATPGKMEAKVSAVIPVSSLSSLEKDGKPYSSKMDDIARGKLRMDVAPLIAYQLDELVLKETPKTPDAPYLFDAKGRLAVAGVTNSISMPVTVTPLGNKKLKITGQVAVKMTDYKIEPPAPVGLLITTGDEVKLSFEWMVGQKAAAPTTSPK